MSNQNNHNADEKGRKPDYIAYQVNQTQDGKGIFNRIGAAWTHKDGQGLQLQLDSLPVDGRITLRELREERMQGYAEGQSTQAAGQTQSRSQYRGRSR
jgi:hypothetical protein